MSFALPQDTPIEGPIHASVAAVDSPRSRKTAASARYLAHDTRNWLTVLQMYCDLLRTPGAVACSHRRWIDELSGAVERGQGLVASLLDSVEESSHESGSPQKVLSTAPQGNATAPARALDLGDALARRLPLFERLAGDKIDVELVAAANAGKVAIGEGAFERILHNLVGNSIEAMPRGGRLRLTLRPGRRSSGNTGGGNDNSEKPDSKAVVLRVFDTGEGIAPECLPFIFESGISSKSDNGQPRGFGLAIVRELTERTGGTVRVRSRPGAGSCFELRFAGVDFSAQAAPRLRR